LQRHAYQTDPLGRKTVYTWCNCGSLAALTDPAGHVTKWHHDLEGRPVTKTYADGTVVNYDYYQYASRLRTKTDALAQKSFYMFNQDDTQEVAGYFNAVNATAPVLCAWDANYKRLASVKKPDWSAKRLQVRPDGCFQTSTRFYDGQSPNIVAVKALSFTCLSMT
jgi:YD repeat-containing protein